MAVLMDQLVGHTENKKWLLEQVKNDRLPSSLIFQGPQGVGKKFLALALLQIMNCQKSESACGQCSDCRRVLEEKNELIFRLQPEGKQSIGVDQVREIHQFLSLQSLKPARFVIIDPADKLSIPAANALLKALEEAPDKTYFILITDRMRSLLPTIRSRSHILKFQNLSREELCQYQDFSHLALQWSGGQLQMALELEEENKADQLNETLRFLYSLLSEAPQDWKKTAPWFFSDDSSREFSLNIWRQALGKRLHGEGENLEWIPESRKLISHIFDSLESLNSDIMANVDKQLAVDNFYYNIRSAE